MELRQRTELRHLMVPELTQSLRVLSMPLMDLKAFLEQEMENNPLLEESSEIKEALNSLSKKLPSSTGLGNPDVDELAGLIEDKPTLQDFLYRQLGIFSRTDDDLKIGQEIIGNINEDGYLKATTEEIAQALGLSVEKIEECLKLIHKFDPPGIAARTIAECLLIQAELSGDDDPLLKKVIESHLEDIAKKNYCHIAKTLGQTKEQIEALAKKISRFNPRPGSYYALQETQNVMPDVIISENKDQLDIIVNDEDIPSLNISQTYKDMLKKPGLDPVTKEFLTQKLHSALEIQRAISKRKFTLRKIVEEIVEIQQEAVRGDFSSLKPLTHKLLAEKLDIHESTVCRTVINKYIELPWGTVPLKKFFSSHLHNTNGDSVSSTHIKQLIKDLIDQEDKQHPLSDQDICSVLQKDNNLNISRRTVAKYRDELKILSTAFRRTR